MKQCKRRPCEHCEREMPVDALVMTLNGQHWICRRCEIESRDGEPDEAA